MSIRLNTSFQKGLKILEFIASCENGAKVSDCAKECDLASSNTTLFLNTLIHCGYLIKDTQTGLYALTGKLNDLAQSNNMDLYDHLKMVALSEMKRLNQLYNENVILSIMSRHHLNAIQEVSSTQAIRIINRQEDFFIPHVTAAGKAILAHLDSKKLNAYLKQCEYQSITSQTLNSEKALLNQLKQIKKQGWALNLGEYDNQVYGVAAPIFSKENVIAAIIVQYPGFRHNEKQLESYAQEILKSAQQISNELN